MFGAEAGPPNTSYTHVQKPPVAPGMPGGTPGPTQLPKPPIISGGTRPPGPQRQPMNAKQQRRAGPPGGRIEY